MKTESIPVKEIQLTQPSALSFVLSSLTPAVSRAIPFVQSHLNSLTFIKLISLQFMFRLVPPVHPFSLLTVPSFLLSRSPFVHGGPHFVISFLFSGTNHSYIPYCLHFNQISFDFIHSVTSFQSHYIHSAFVQ